MRVSILAVTLLIMGASIGAQAAQPHTLSCTNPHDAGCQAAANIYNEIMANSQATTAIANSINTVINQPVKDQIYTLVAAELATLTPTVKSCSSVPKITQDCKNTITEVYQPLNVAFISLNTVLRANLTNFQHLQSVIQGLASKNTSLGSLQSNPGAIELAGLVTASNSLYSAYTIAQQSSGAAKGMRK